jgi:hypothetical protein
MSAPSATIPQLAFRVEDASAMEHAAVPTLLFRVGVETFGDEPIRALQLDTQIQIAARRRPYDEGAQERLLELFGTPDRWGSTLRTLPWTRVTVVVPPFTGSTVVDMPVTCTYDLEVTAAKYLQALDHGDVPLEFLFSGAVFYLNEAGMLQTARIAWDREAEYALPVRVWRQAMDRHFPGSAWLRLDKESFDRLYAYKARHALPTWEATVDSLLGEREED